MGIRGFRARRQADDAVQLDESQRAVLALPDGASAVVVGPPGSGKTATLIEFVADRIDAGAAPGEVLVLSPTRTAATLLRDRIALRLHVPTGGPMARTAVSVAFETVRGEAARRGDAAPRLLTGAEQDSIVADLLEGHAESGSGPAWPDGLGPEVRRLPAFRTELRELASRATEANLPPSDLAALGERTGHPEWVAAAAFLEDYQEVLDSYRASSYDAAELLAEASALVRGGSGAHVPRVVLVDDAQELGTGTAELLAAWVARGSAVVAFGDPDIASTGFRGGRAELLARLGGELGIRDLPTLVLTGSHRAAPELREVTAAVTTRIGAAGFGLHRYRPAARPSAGPTVEELTPVGLPGTSSQGSRPRVLRIEAAGRPEEIARLGHRLRELHIHEDVPWDRMAVVVRSGRLVPAFARGLAAAEVPTRTSLAARPLREEWAARHLVDAVALATGTKQGDAEAYAALLTGPLGGLDAVGLRRLRLALRQEELAGEGARSAEELLVEAMSAAGRFATLDSPQARRAGRLSESLELARRAHAEDASIEELLWLFWERSGLARTWGEQSQGTGVLADEANRHLDSAVALFTAAQRFAERAPGQPATVFLEQVLGADLPEDTLAPHARQDAVLVGAPASVLGEEFDVVAVSGLQDGVWPNLRLRGTLLHADRVVQAVEDLPVADLDARKEVLDDELRMFALAVSRARSFLLLTSVANVDEQPSSLFRLLPPDLPIDREVEPPPLTLRGLVGRLRRELVRHPTSPAASALARLAGERVPGADPASWYGLLPVSTDEPLVDLSEPEQRVPVSPSHLATVERSPLGWFVDVMAASPSGMSASIGTVLHSAMEKLSATPDADVSPQAVMAAVDERWNEFQFESPWVEEYERRRTTRLAEGLSDYLGGFRRDGHELLGAETGFEFTLGSAVVRGKIDRVERTADGTVVIVDLKTGRTMPSLGEIPTHAQLGLYQLAVEHEALPVAPEAGERGAKLVFVAGKTKDARFKVFEQQRLDEESLEQFRQRVAAAASTMAGTLFPGTEGLDDHDPYARYAYRIHLVPAVSA